MAGTKNSELIKQVVIEMTISAPKYFKGVKLDKISGIKHTITESALIIIPLPDVLRVIRTAFLWSFPLDRSVLKRHKKWMV